MVRWAAMSGVAMATPGARSPRNVPARRSLHGSGRLRPSAGRSAAIAWPVSRHRPRSGHRRRVLVPILWPGELPGHPDYVKRPHLQPAAPASSSAAQGLGDRGEARAGQARHPGGQAREAQADRGTEMPKEEELKPEARDAGDRAGGERDRAATWACPKAWRAAPRAAWWAVCSAASWAGVSAAPGDGPVMDYDQPPRPIKITRPAVPSGGLRQEDRGHGGGRDPHRLHGPRGGRPRGEVDSPPGRGRPADRAAVGLHARP